MSEKKIRRTASLEIMLRYVIIALLLLCAAGAISIALFNTTVVHADAWREKANRELSKVTVIPPVRGDILACDGSVLATNLRYYTVRMDMRASGLSDSLLRVGLDSLCDSLAHYHPSLTRKEWRLKFERQLSRQRKDRSQCMLIVRNISNDELLRLQQFPFYKRFRNPNKNGLSVEAFTRRSYPYGDMARRSVGTVGQTAEDDAVRGRSGLECALDSLLYGIPGKAKRVPLTRNISNWTDVPAVDGKTLRTTIDIGMQDIVENELNAMLELTRAKWGTVILMEVGTGDIKAISNLERDSVSGRYIEAMNRAVQRFEPGSVMKTISMVVALREGFVRNLDQVYQIGGGYVFGGGRPIRDTHSPAELPVRRFLEYSSNIGMTKLVAPHYTADPDSFRRTLKAMGFFDRFNTGIAEEVPPRFPDLRGREDGPLVSLGRMTYGYATLISPLYMCAFYNAVAGDGRFIRPRIVKGIITANGTDSTLPVTTVRPQPLCTPQQAAMVRSMLREVVYGKGGTAKMLKNDFVELAGKTGTSKIAREISRQELERSRRAMALARTHADSVAARPKNPGGYIEGHYRLSFCGFFPYSSPRYTCMVMVSDPSPEYKGAGYTSGVVCRNIALKMYQRGMLGNSSDYRVNDDGTPAVPHGTLPTVHAGNNPERANLLKQFIGAPKVRRITAPAAVQRGAVPNVRGLSLRQAVRTLEEAGYRVRVSGTGYVADQNPAPGTRARHGSPVALTLRL